MYRILLVEDEHKIAAALKTGLEEHGFEVTVAPDGLAGKELFWNRTFHLAIIDVNLPRKDGYSLCREIRSMNDRVGLMMLTAFSSTDNKLQGFDAGADDYLVKPFEFRELLARVRVLLKRLAVTQEEVVPLLCYGDVAMNTERQEVTRGGSVIHLTNKEYQLLEYFLRHPEKVLSRAEISNDVWDIDFDTQTNITDVYVNFLRKKIDRGFPVKLLHTVIGRGYVLKSEPDAA